MVATKPKLVTVDELWEMRHEPYRFTLLDGELFTMPGARGTHGRLAVYASAHLLRFVGAKSMGEIYVETGFRLFRDRLTTVFPDVAFVRADRVPEWEEEERYLTLVPDLAIEIVSPTDDDKLLKAKLAAYQEARTPLVWRMYPRTSEVHVFRPGRSERVLQPGDWLGGENILPGLSIRVADLFSPPRY